MKLFYFLLKQKLLWPLLAFPLFLSSQTVHEFPPAQSPYIGGYEAYYKDFHDIVLEKKLQPCADKSQFYQFSVLINADASINFIKDQHPNYLANNKCASDLAREVAKYQTKWNPAVINGFAQPAIARFTIFPDQIFEKNNTQYSPVVTTPVYNNVGEDHMNHFWKQLKSNMDLRRFRWEDRFTIEAEFIITKEGKLEDILLTKKTGLEEFDRMLFYAFKSMKKKWKPATVNGIPVDFRYKYHLTATTDPEY